MVLVCIYYTFFYNKISIILWSLQLIFEWQNFRHFTFTKAGKQSNNIHYTVIISASAVFCFAGQTVAGYCHKQQLHCTVIVFNRIKYDYKSSFSKTTRSDKTQQLVSHCDRKISHCSSFSRLSPMQPIKQKLELEIICILIRIYLEIVRVVCIQIRIQCWQLAMQSLLVHLKYKENG